jgi:probable rRNA maturation factor
MFEVSNETEYELKNLEFSNLVKYVLQQMEVGYNVECSITMVDIDTMTELNKKWMGENRPTDVLSFPIDELKPYTVPPENAILGDIVLCPEYALENATNMGHSLRDELLILTVHSVLHLLGMDHAKPEDKDEMFKLQRKLLLGFLSTNSPNTNTSRIVFPK